MIAKGQTNSSEAVCLESVNRISKFPVVESSIYTANNIYEKIKEFNWITRWTCSTAENVVTKAVEVGKPMVQGLIAGPIKKVDGVLCTGLDYVETKVPAVKLPPGEILCQIVSSTKDYVDNTVTPAVETAYSFVEPAVKTAYERIEPAVQTAKTVMEPAIVIVEPYVQPALEKVQHLKESATKKFEELMHHCGHNHPEADFECEECQAAAEKMKRRNNEQ